MAPATSYGSQRYDAFGRQVQTYDVDGTVTLQSVYHALSTDLYDAADLQPGSHQGNYASTRSDGHGRAIRTTERAHASGAIEARFIETSYLATGEPFRITRRRALAADSVTRWMRYDSLGRMVLNVEPNTSAGFEPDPNAEAPVGGSLKAWRYVYDHQGALVGTSDARGCGVNFAHDAAGRLLGEDYSPCEAWPPAYSAPGAGMDGYEIYHRYDTIPGDVPAPTVERVPAWALGRFTMTCDRGSVSLTYTDGRARVTEVLTKLAVPNAHIARSPTASPCSPSSSARASRVRLPLGPRCAGGIPSTFAPAASSSSMACAPPSTASRSTPPPPLAPMTARARRRSL
ncbi:MAG: hypothetical protein JW751_08655, partial [Polyangiaceae bacterium]|nr:hypothetical protein [Polyangiaceae bacterium]